MFRVEYRLKAAYGEEPNETVVLPECDRYWFDVRVLHGYAPYEGASIDLIIHLAKAGEDGKSFREISMTSVEYLEFRAIGNAPKAD